ncbi:Intradiol ring-cleavage dioxygenase [Cantharellus anzutake]|uniref:Intradiol ring-cleavage dioxygenase n=1 Tax=Cantharellus anzutake TaxID=1750568 RepID=UPI00190764A8|nr:Intradiol ring-cleavage dioxygenase [Cantharellus anzutake]KAF8335880.1 Intradiol ring-cleavage dioxygenase [Cantharellus anzutake]
MRTVSFLLAVLVVNILSLPAILSKSFSPYPQLESEARNRAARNCASAIRAFQEQRRTIRDFSKKLSGLEKLSNRAINGPLWHKPKGIRNTTCVLTPEVTEGPYYIKNELVRRDIREGQPGVPLILDIGVLDITTCKPLPNAFVELWNSNSTGFYSGFTESVLPPPPPGISPNMTDELDFLRGGWPTNKKGVVEMITTYPGYYTLRTVHVHTAIQTHWKKARNGTIISDAGHLLHRGQIFFEDSLTDKVVVTNAYLNNTKGRTYNSQDGIFQQENSHGYNAIADTYRLGPKIGDGILAYVTIGVDSTARYSFNSTDYWNP